MFISMNDLQKQMGDGQSIAELREMTGAGGLSGVFKMTATLPLFTFLSTSALLMFCKIDRKSKKILHRTLIVSVICLAVKVALVFDRLSILAVLIVVVYNYFFNKSISKVVKVGAVALLLCAVSYLTLLRMSDGSIKDFLVLYFNLSVVNLQIDIDTQTNFNYNFSETFLQPLSYIFKYFGLRFHSYGPKNYCWNPAQSFWGDFFIDFNWVGLFFMPFLGYCIRKIEYARYSNVYFQIIYFLLAYTFFSFSTVPIIRSIEFWLMLIVGRFMAKKLVTVR
jgi:oligosaccharide repeat unit polymerase